MMRRGPLIPPTSELEASLEKDVRSFAIQTRWLYEGDLRLDASFYADDALAARRIIEESGFLLKTLADPSVTQRIFWPSRFKRVYTTNPAEGFAFLQASETLLFRPTAQRWLAKSKAPNTENYFAKKGWILITRSGVVGRCVLVGKRLEQFFLSDDLLRVIPTMPSGYLYAFLSTWMGQALMTKGQYGGTISHLEPHHLQDLPVPLLPESTQRAIHEQILQAYRLRDEANDLLDRAEELLHKELDLPRFDERKVPYLFGTHKPKVFTVKRTELSERFDASFHVPIAKAAIEQMKQGKYPLIRLGEVAQRIFIPPRFKRIYVKPEHGVPFLQPSHIPLIKPFDLRFISKRANAQYISECLLNEGWILITRSGTVGRALFVSKHLTNWVGSDDLIRIIPNLKRLHPGYLTAFLMTPYGHHQLTREVYGGVVDHLEEEHIAAVWLPNAPLEVQRRIGTLVVEAFEKKEEANLIEKEAITQLEDMLVKGKDGINNTDLHERGGHP